MDDPPPFAAWLRAQRTQHDLTQEALAEQVGCSVDMIRKLESATRQPSATLRRQLVACLAPTPNQVSRETEEPFGPWLRQQRKARDWTQDDLGQRIGYTKDSVHLIEVGKMRPARQAVAKLAEVLQIAAGARPAFLAWARGVGPAAPPAAPVPPARPTPSNLPRPLTSLLGREAEIRAVTKLLGAEAVRLVTLTGAPGIGKTRLALAVAALLRDQFADGSWFVALGPLTDPNLVASTIAAALGIQETATEAAPERLRSYLRDKRLLLVLDNFEQVLAAGALVTDLLGAAPQVSVLVTSRTLLEVYGEHVFLVAPLQLPDAQVPQSLDTLMQVPTVALFVQRATAIQPGFALTGEMAPAVSAICQRLEGLPLAIELAAGRMRELAPAALLARLDHRLDVLLRGPRDRPPRQQTLRDALAWSYELLTAAEQILLSRLGVFVGGCTAAAVAAVGAAAALAGGDASQPVSLATVQDRLLALVAQNLLQCTSVAAAEPRFTMLETIREYALERLAASGTMTTVREQHAAYFLAFVGRSELGGLDQVAWLDRLDQEHDNLRAALTYCLATGDTASAVRFGAALARFWYTRGYLSEGRQWLARILALPALADSPIPYANALNGASALAWAQGDQAAARTFQETHLALQRTLNDRTGLATALCNLGLLVKQMADYATARTLYEESLAIQQEMGDPASTATILQNLGTLAHAEGDYPTARPYYVESLAQYRASADLQGVAGILSVLGELAHVQGDQAEARAYLEESLALGRTVGDQRGIGFSLQCLSGVCLAQGTYTEAHRYAQESLRLRQELGDQPGLADSLEGVAALAAVEGQAQRATQLYSATAALRQTLAAPHVPPDHLIHERLLADLEATLGPGGFAAAWQQGQTLARNQVLTLAQTASTAE